MAVRRFLIKLWPKIDGLKVTLCCSTTSDHMGAHISAVLTDKTVQTCLDGSAHLVIPLCVTRGAPCFFVTPPPCGQKWCCCTEWRQECLFFSSDAIVGSGSSPVTVTALALKVVCTFNVNFVWQYLSRRPRDRGLGSNGVKLVPN